ncbi:MAG: glycosyltransferase [Myxococcota bacterium]|nr:glycosyltransferase [Myxococcota bacterium]
MRIALFCHSLLSDWNHGNAHFLRGVVTELVSRDHDVRVFEPRDAWSVQNLVSDHGERMLDLTRMAFPAVRPTRYGPETLDLDEVLDGCALVLVHEWNDPELVRRIGEHRIERGRYTLLFHDTHHRSVTAPEQMGRLDLSGYDGVLAFGDSVRQAYVQRGWSRRVFTWHEAADVRTFRPVDREGGWAGDLVWVGNWGDDERTQELSDFLISPCKSLGLRATVHGVRYPPAARKALAEAQIHWAGWVPNFRVPAVFAQHRFTVHVPRGAYAKSLPGIPTIRPFEALACAIPLVSSPWDDTEGLFAPGRDFLVARDSDEMCRHMRALLHDEPMARELAERGRKTVLARHTCGHRVDELMTICASLGVTGAIGDRRAPDLLESA